MGSVTQRPYPDYTNVEKLNADIQAQMDSFTLSLEDKAQQTDLSDITYTTRSFPIQSPEIDDTARLQRAINKATTDGKRLAISGNITIGAVTLTCDLIGLPGHQITIKSGGGFSFVSTALSVKVDGLNIIAQSNYVFKSTGSTKYNNIDIRNCSTNTTTTDTSILFLNLISTSRVTVKDCNLTVGGIQVVSADECLIQGNVIDAQYKNDNEPIQVSTRSVARILDNTVYNSRSDIIDLYSSGYETIVRGNKGFGIKSSTYGSACMECKVIIRDVGNPSPGSNEAGFVRNTIIEGNIFKDVVNTITNSTMVGIYAEYIDNRTGTPAWDQTQTNEGFIIKNNIIENMTYDTGVTGASSIGVQFSGINGIIEGNILKNIDMQTNVWTTCGIHLGGTYAQAVGVNVVNNLLITASVGVIIDIASSCNISNNIVRKNDKNTISPRYGVSIYQSLVESNINNNVLHTIDFPLYSNTTATIQKCNFNNNQLKASNAGATGYVSFNCDYQSNNFNNNILKNIMFIAQATSLKFGNTIKDNKFLIDFAGNGVFLDYQNGFTVSGNTFDNATNGIRLLANCQNGILKDNISRQSAGTVVNNGATVNINQLDNVKI